MTRLTVGRWITNANAGHVDVAVVAHKEVGDRIQDPRPRRQTDSHTRLDSLDKQDNVQRAIGVDALDDGQGKSSGRIASHDAEPVASMQKGASEATRSLSMPPTRIKAGKLSFRKTQKLLWKSFITTSIAPYNHRHCARGLSGE